MRPQRFPAFASTIASRRRFPAAFGGSDPGPACCLGYGSQRVAVGLVVSRSGGAPVGLRIGVAVAVSDAQDSFFGVFLPFANRFAVTSVHPLSSWVRLSRRMTPHAFIEKWRASQLKERSASQEQFIDLCHLLGEPTPAEADPSGETYCFERGARKDTGGDGWADVWKRHHFAWEYKGKRADLDAAFDQLRQYSLALENPPLLIVSDMVRFRIRTNWTNTVSRTHEFDLAALADASTRDRLKWAFSDPDRLRPGETRQALTERVAASFASVAQALRERGHDPQPVAHFVNRLVFCMFADDVGLLPDHMFTRMLRHARPAPERFTELAGDLFEVMATGGRVGFETVAWFNGGLFDDSTVLPLERSDIDTVLAASDLDWSEIDPSILGTLFERGLDPGKRAQLGAHYTDRDKIMLLVEPVVVRPLLAEWEAEQTAIIVKLLTVNRAKSSAVRTKRWNQAEQRYRAFLERPAHVHGARSGVRFGELSLLGAAGSEGP